MWFAWEKVVPSRVTSCGISNGPREIRLWPPLLSLGALYEEVRQIDERTITLH